MLSNAPRVQSVSSINLFTGCPYKYWLKYVANIEPVQRWTDRLERGTAFHAGMEAHYLGQDVEAAVRASDVPAEAHDAALLALNAYRPHLPAGEPILIGGTPATEFAFEECFKAYGVTLRGHIDAVLKLGDGRTVMVDWKLRADSRSFYREYPLQIDRQLPVYAAVLRHRFGVAVDAIYQAQFSFKTPAVPRLLQGCDGSKHTDYHAKLGPTTAETLQQATDRMSEEEAQLFSLKYLASIRPIDEFIQWTPIQYNDAMLRATLEAAVYANTATVFPARLDAYTCKACDFLQECRKRHGVVDQERLVGL